MKPTDIKSINRAFYSDFTIEELENRLEAATCTEIDLCFAQYCWQFASEYTCSTECIVLCEPFNGCQPYCFE